MNKIKITAVQLSALDLQVNHCCALAATGALLEEASFKTPAMNDILDQINELSKEKQAKLAELFEIVEEEPDAPN